MNQLKRRFVIAMATAVMVPMAVFAQNADVEVQGNAVPIGDPVSHYEYNYWLHNANMFETRNVSSFTLSEVYSLDLLAAPADWVGVFIEPLHTVEFTYQLGQYPMTPLSYQFGFYYESTSFPILVDYEIFTDDGVFIGTVVGAGNVTAVELDDFVVNTDMNGARISWTMLEESGVAGYNVYRNGERLNSSIIAAANVNGAEYFFTDSNPVSGTYTLAEVAGSGEEVSLATYQYDANVPSGYELSQNFPNPFNPSTAISYNLAEAGNVNLSVYNLVGEPVAELVNDHMSAGTHTVEFDASSLPSGIYFYTLNAGDVSLTRKMSLVK